MMGLFSQKPLTLPSAVTAYSLGQATDEALVAAARNGQREAYTILVERYRTVAYAYAFSRLRSCEEAEDVVQETFVRGYAALDRFRLGGCWGAWVMRILRNLCYDILRQRRDRPLEPIPEEWLDSAPTPEVTTLAGEQRQELRAAVDALPDKYRLVLLMHYGSGQKCREVALALGLPETTVKGRLVSALRLLRRRLNWEEAR